MASPQASVIVLSYNSKGDLPACLSAVLAQKGIVFETIVVDNASSDGSADYVAQKFPQIKLARSPVNGGYAAGNNLGAQSAAAPILVFLNPDTIVQPGWLAGLLDTLKANPDAACACSKVVFADRPDFVNSVGLFMSRLGFAGGLGDGQPSDRFQNDLPLFAPSGCSLAISAERFKQLGGFDDSFFLYQEDLDLGWRAANRGWRSMLASQSVVWHAYKSPGKKDYFYFYATRNLGWAIRKNMAGIPKWHLLGHYALFSCAMAAGSLLLLRPGAMASILRGLHQGLFMPLARDAHASPAGWGRMLGIGPTLSILWAKLRKHSR